jgi:hypothetical protein
VVPGCPAEHRLFHDDTPSADLGWTAIRRQDGVEQYPAFRAADLRAACTDT